MQPNKFSAGDMSAPTDGTGQTLDVFIRAAVHDALSGRNQEEKEQSAALRRNIQANMDLMMRVRDECQMSSLIGDTSARDKEIEAMRADIQKASERLDVLERFFPDFAEVTRLHDVVTELDRRLDKIIDSI